ncbi:MAG: hypothetical protein KAI47_21780 [Deltaproteobacteria bacterium]|nr:hypothetical protein [Deltaproteobacteria bacterium]
MKSKTALLATTLLCTAMPLAEGRAAAAPKTLGLFGSVTAAINMQLGYAEVDWVPGYQPTPTELMRNNTRAGLHARMGLVAWGSLRAGASLSFHARLPKYNPGYDLLGVGLHLAWQHQVARRTALGGGVDVDKLFSPTSGISTGWRVFPQFDWDIFFYNAPGNRHGLQFRCGVFFEFGMDGPPMTEMANEFTMRPQLELGWVWGGY